jgi:hypothetical protein
MMAPMRPIALGTTIAAVLVLAGCASSGAPTAPASAGTPSGPTSEASVAARSPGASPSKPKPSASQALAIPHEAPKLEALLPDEVDGAKLTKLSVGPVSSIGVAGAQGIKDVAKQIGDGSNNFGLAYAGDPAGKFNLFVLQIAGAKPAALMTSFAQMTLAETPGGKVESAHLGGRDLVHVIDPLSQIGDVWFYATGDTLFGVQAGSPDQATKLLALLP